MPAAEEAALALRFLTFDDLLATSDFVILALPLARVTISRMPARPSPQPPLI